MGIGAFGFVTGPYFGLNASYTAARGSSIGLVMRNQETVDVKLIGGIGYAIPQAVTSAINAIFRALNAKPMQGQGGVQAPLLPFVNKAWVRPDVKVCRPE